MAKAAPKEEAPAAAPVVRKNRKKLIVAALAVVLLLGIGGAAAFFLKHRSDGDADAGAGAQDKLARKSRRDAPPVFVRLEVFTVKLQSDGEAQEQYLQATPELRVLDSGVSDKVKLYMPEIRHKALLLLSSKRPSEISTPQGMERLSVELREQINQILDGSAAKPAAEIKADADPADPTQAVLFTSFIIQ